MRVLFLSSFPPHPSPEADFALRLCERLGEAGVEVVVLTTRGSAAPARKNLTVLPLIGRWDWAALPVIAATAGRLQPDAVLLSFVNWVFGFHAMITFAPTLLRRVLPRAPFVTILHNADTYPVEFMDSTESLLLACFAGFRVAEVPTRIRPRSAGQPSTRHLRLVLNYLRLLVVIVGHLSRPRRAKRVYS